VLGPDKTKIKSYLASQSAKEEVKQEESNDD